VCLTASAASQSDAILKMMIRERESVYVSTLRTEPIVRDELDRGSHQLSEVAIEYAGGSTPIETATRSVEQVDGQVNVIVDPLNPLERGEYRERYVSFLNDLKEQLVNTGSIGLMHCHEENQPALRELTLAMADAVWKLELDTAGSTLENRLMFPKMRGEESPQDVISVTLGSEVTVDLSRDIA
jgi:hypothetical protein